MKKGWARWTAADDDALRRLYGQHPTRLVAERMGRSLIAVYRRAERLGLMRPGARTRFSYRYGHSIMGCTCHWHRQRHWKPDEVAFLELNYGRLPTDEIARRLNRTKLAVYHKARDLGIDFRENREAAS